MMIEQTIPLIEPYLGKKARLYVDECFDSCWISSRGHFIPDFERAFARFVGTKHAVAVTNGTVALHLALLSLNIGEGDEVIVPDLTFAATINAVLHARATPVIVDIDPDTWNISPARIREAITSKTRAIIPVHLYGYPCNMSEIAAIGVEYGLKIIEDAAEAHGAEYQGKKVGSLGDIGAFSFYGNKIITTGEGGMCTTDDDEVYEKMLVMRDHGMNKNNKYKYDVVGYNYRMTNPQAALGLAQLEEIDDILRRRRNVGIWYDEQLTGVDGIEIRCAPSNIKPVVWLYTCLARHRDEVMARLARNNIETRPMFYPLHQMDIYKQYVRHRCACSIGVAYRGITLPTYYTIPNSFVERVCKVVQMETADVC
ncbi:GDP-perosamine synthase [Rubrivivax sp. A210]|uniref:DegT/DnrJ/EryC1/StrS family aminotransferase n=1 Tax=Rubrivivax sp. A210 TaxID=2772301 RepID=UPI00191A787E|nr:DegT/DnrJ/EryC1/StrS family aminotransferase [Rubrivivax sp. A210]CAD5372460.1 GDP-perosamine synthase [Rubrivivax sp. A210]